MKTLDVIIGIEELRAELEKYHDFKSNYDEKYFIKILNEAGEILSKQYERKGEKLIILNLGDEDVNQNFLIKTTKTEKQVAKKVAFIINRFEDENNEEWFNEEWTFDGVIEELVDAGFVKLIPTDDDWEIYA